MSIEEQLERIADAVENVATALLATPEGSPAADTTAPPPSSGKKKTSKKKASKKKTSRRSVAEPEEDDITLEAVRAKLVELERSQALDVLTRCGVAKLSELPTNLYAKAIKIAEDVLAGTDDAESEQDNDDIL